MNKGRLILGIGLIVLSAAIFFVFNSSNMSLVEYDNEDEGPNARIEKKEALDDVHAIHADGVISVQITQGDTEQVRYVYNPKYYKNKSTFENGELNLDFSSAKKRFRIFGFKKSSGVNVYVTVKKLKVIEMEGVGSVRTTNQLIAESLSIKNEGTGSMKIDLLAKNLEAKNEGVGSLKLSGSCDIASLQNSGVGSLNARSLKTQEVKADNEGVGSMKVYAEKKFNLSNSGVGSLSYSGDGEVESVRSEGVGSVTKK